MNSLFQLAMIIKLSESPILFTIQAIILMLIILLVGMAVILLTLAIPIYLIMLLTRN